MKIKDLRSLYIDGLRDVYSAETQLIKALPKMAEAANSPELKKAIKNHLVETKKQADRLEQIFSRLEYKPAGETCEAMKGLIKEGEDLIKKSDDPDARDAGIIMASQKVEHYEIASYGTLCTWADLLGEEDDQRLLRETLDEEHKANDKLNEVATSGVNRDALEDES